MEPTLNESDATLVEQFGRIVSDAAGAEPIPADDVTSSIERRFARIDEAITSGGWQQAAAEGATEGPASLLVAMVEAAARPLPTVVYPVVEMWMAHRILAVARLEAPVADGLLIGDASAVLGSDGEVVWPHVERARALVRLRGRDDGRYDVVWSDVGDATWELVTQPDLTRPVSKLVDPGSGGTVLGSVEVNEARGLAAEQLLLEASEMLGCAQGLFDAVARHLSVREQFGQRLSSFQALRHRLADAHVALETVRSLVAYGAWVADSRPGDAIEFALMAKGAAGDHCWSVADESIQLHGAMGFTWEMNLQHPTSRIITRSLATPNAEWCLEEVGRLVRRRGSMIALVE